MKKEMTANELGLKVILYFEKDELISVDLKSISISKHNNYPVHQRKIEKSIQNYFSKRSDEFSKLPLDLSGYTEMEKKVLKAMRKVPFGSTVSYKELASMSGNSRMSRFVGNVCKKNRFPLLIPCHRVIKSDGTLGGYSGGINIKKKLLKFENHSGSWVE